jgi:hypothetical protein
MQRFRRIEKLTCSDGLKKLLIGNASHLSDLSPLASCSMMVISEILDSCIVDIPLEVFICRKRPSIKDLSPLAACPRLKKLDLWGNGGIKDLSLYQLAQLLRL